uniref:Uncharacterized protein n=1 Tax=Arion vulgaris TaxID=1028688 RepID=A0A0B7BGY2_9EUPU
MSAFRVSTLSIGWHSDMEAAPASQSALSLPKTYMCPGTKIRVILQIVDACSDSVQRL